MFMFTDNRREKTSVTTSIVSPLSRAIKRRGRVQFSLDSHRGGGHPFRATLSPPGRDDGTTEGRGLACTKNHVYFSEIIFQRYFPARDSAGQQSRELIAVRFTRLFVPRFILTALFLVRNARKRLLVDARGAIAPLKYSACRFRP